jgi:hypothetical protein
MSLAPPTDIHNSSSSSSRFSSSFPTRSDNATAVSSPDSSGDPIIEVKHDGLTVQNLDQYPSYTNYVQALAEHKYPSLQVVLEFLNSLNQGDIRKPAHHSEQSDGCILCCYFRLSVLALFADNTHTQLCSFEQHSDAPPDKLVEGMLRVVIETGQKSTTNKLQRLILLVEDIKPQGMKVSFRVLRSKTLLIILFIAAWDILQY